MNRVVVKKRKVMPHHFKMNMQVVDVNKRYINKLDTEEMYLNYYDAQ
jgi:hypothetical protein